jgi:hypothetical protein
MTYELATISVHDLNRVTGAGGRFDAMMMERQQHPQKHTSAASSPKGPSELGNICRDAYTATGAVVGGATTSETGGWGVIPGTIIGGAIGRAVCPP